MKKLYISILTFLIFFCIGTSGYSQINRTLSTKIADVLAQMPTKNLKHNNALMERVLNLKKEGIIQLCDMLIPLGTGDDTQVRYAINSLAIYVGGKNNTVNKNIVENALLASIKKSPFHEVKIFLIERLQFCASNASIKKLNDYLYGDKFYKSSLAVLTSIRSSEAAQAILDALKESKGNKQAAYITALGELKYKPAISALENLSNSNSLKIRQSTLKSLAKIASPSSYQTLYNAAKKVAFQPEKSEAVLSFIYFGMHQNSTKINKKIATALLKNCSSDSQLHFRTAGLQLLSRQKEISFTKRLLKEFKHKNDIYRGSVIEIASENLNSNDLLKWSKSFKRTSSMGKIQLLGALHNNKDASILPLFINPAIKNKDKAVRVSGIKALAYQSKNNAFPILFNALKNVKSPVEITAIKESLLRLSSSNDIDRIANHIEKSNDNGKVVLIELLAAKRATSKFTQIYALLNNTNKQVTNAIYKALPSVSNSGHLSKLMMLLNSTDKQEYIASIQQAITTVLDQSKGDLSTLVLEAHNRITKKEKLN